jgi:hypothetical protein
MDVSKKIVSSLIISSVSLSIYSAPPTMNIKKAIELSKNEIQNLAMQRVAASQTDVATNHTNSSAPKKNKNGKQLTLVNNKNNRQINPKNSSGGDDSLNIAPDAKIAPANYIPHFIWQGPDLAALMVGSASAGFSKPSGSNGSFNILDFNPIFLFSYKELLFIRSSIDFSLDDQSNTNVSLDYINLNLFLHDYAVFGIGKFDSALGYFGQNLSPAWINRMPDAPVGFEGDQAAPQADVGMRLQGGIPVFNKMKVNYALYIANGNQAFVDTTNLMIDHLGTEGYTNNFGNYVYAGRLGFLPIPKLEIGVSAATGKLVLIDLNDGMTVLQRSRGYRALGADLSYKPGNWDLRAEFIQQQISSQSNSIVPQGKKWKAWYAQAAYWILNTPWEPVVRYSKFTAPVASQGQSQWAFGIDYWFAPSIGLQAAFELNRGQSGADTNDNLFLIQLAFGF